ncbi:MAG: class I SAM-dependent methyltransferase [Bacteroidota bacterium]|nr:class I SAM-dependent methyltransferase [Bacteroidota bacterium]
MSLEQKIIENYGNRINKDEIYNSIYSKLAVLEKTKKIEKIVSTFIEITPNTSILEIGAGQGGNIPLLLKLGFKESNIYLNEILPERISALKRNYPNIKIFEGNAININYNRTFDIVFQSTVFTSILNEKDRINLATKIWNILNPHGVVLWYDFIYNNPKNKNVKKVAVKEVIKLFSEAYSYKILKVTLAPPIGRRVGKLYNLFNFPFLRSHILAVFHKK